MWRLLPFLLATVVVAGIALTFLVVAPAVERRNARRIAEDKRRDALAEYQQRAALEDLERTRERINRDQDGYYTERHRELGEPENPR